MDVSGLLVLFNPSSAVGAPGLGDATVTVIKENIGNERRLIAFGVYSLWK